MRLRQSRRMRPGDGLLLAALGGLILLLYGSLWSANPEAQSAIAPGDMTVYYYPFARTTIESLLAGQIPLWNPYVLGGHPYLAEMQTQALYPIRWVTALLTLGQPFSYRALAAETIAHLVLAAWGAYGFFRWLSRNRAAATFGAVAWSLGGYLTGYPLQAPPILATAAWLPWLLLALGRALGGNAPVRERFWRRNAVLATLCWALVFLSGFAQTALYVYGIALLWGGVLVLSQPRQERRRALLTLLCIVVIGSGLAAAQLLPTAEATTLAERLDQPLEERLAGFKLPELLGLLIPHITLWSPLYVGIPTLLFSGLTLRRRALQPLDPRHPAPWLGLALLGVLLSLGNATPFLPTLARLLPILGMFRNPERAAVITAWALTTLAVLGWQRPGPLRLRQAPGIIWGLSGLLLAGWFLWTRFNPGATETTPWLSRGFWSWAILGASWLMVLQLPKTQWLLVALLAADLGASAWQTAITGHLVQQDPAEAAMLPPLQIPLPKNVQGRRVDTRGHLTGGWPAILRLEDLHGHLTFQNGLWMRFRQEIPGERVWALMGVGCGIWGADEPDPPWAMRQVADFTYAGMSLRLLCLEQPFPRYRVVYEAAALEDGIALGVLPDPRYDLNRAVILESTAPELSVAAPPVSPTVTLLDWRPEATRLAVQSAQPGYLIIGDLWYPGWTARVDGERTPILRAYTALRAIQVPEGEHEVSLRYEPLSFRIGVGITFLALLALLVVSLRMWRSPSKIVANHRT
ncbi:MAG: hypothetical protein JW892_13865 [Anaerolineae bacterium]|nr:hypothetical protein [Anaerolineae bacterium]